MSNDVTQGKVIKGELSATNPAKLIFLILKREKSGLLVFDDGVTKTRVFFKNGTMIPYFSGIRTDKNFVRFLIQHKKVTRDEVKICRKIAQEKKKKTIDVLIEKEILNKADTEKDATDFYWKTMEGIFAWRHGKFSFTDKDFNYPEKDPDQARTLRAIYDGILTRYNPGLIQARLKNRMKKKILKSKSPDFPLEMLNLNEQEKEFFKFLEKGDSIHASLGKCDLAHSDAMALAFTLLTLGYVKFKSKPKPKKKKKSAIDVAMEAAASSVDRIHEEVKLREEEEQEIPVSSPTEQELQAKLAKMYGSEPGGPPPAGGQGEEDIGVDLGQLAGMDDDEEIEQIVDENGFIEDDGEMDDGEEFTFADDETIGEEELGLGELPDFDEDADADLTEFDDFEGDDADLTFSASDSPQDVFKLGLTYEEQGAYETAAKAFQEAIDREFNTAEVHSHLGWAIYNANKQMDGFDKGAEIIQDAIKVDPNSHFPYLFLGKIYETESDLSMAELYYVKALELNRECEDAKSHIKQIYDNR